MQSYCCHHCMNYSSQKHTERIWSMCALQFQETHRKLIQTGFLDYSRSFFNGCNLDCCRSAGDAVWMGCSLVLQKRFHQRIVLLWAEWSPRPELWHALERWRESDHNHSWHKRRKSLEMTELWHTNYDIQYKVIIMRFTIFNYEIKLILWQKSIIKKFKRS